MISHFNQELAKKKIKFLLSTFSHKYFISKNILDAGSGTGEIGAAFFRLGSFVTAIDARQENLTGINKKYPAIKIIKSDFELPSTINKKFDIILSIGTLCHLNNYQEHLKDLCGRTKDLILETAVCNSDDPDTSFQVSENSTISSLSMSGTGSRPSAANIEKILSENGMFFVRLDVPELNYENYVYDWEVSNSNKREIFLRRFWICSKHLNVVNEIAKKTKKTPNLTKLNFISQESTNEPPQIVQPAPVFKNKINNNEPEVIYNPNYVKYKSLNDKKFVIVIPSYKNEKWAERNILSALNQNYSNFRIIYTDDCSPDKTFEVVKGAVDNHENKIKTTLIKNSVRCGALENLYNMIHSCEDDEIILTLDGDDWLADNEVLNKLNQIYQEDVWMTYGQYKCHPHGGGHCRQIPDVIIKSNSFRQHAWLSSHLRTFYAWLFKMIKKEDLMYQDKFAPSAWDMYIMYPLLEMAGTHSKFISDILYIYNLENPINDHKVDRGLQASLDKVSRSMRKYSPLNQSPLSSQSNTIDNEKYTVGLLLIATGKYDRYLQQLIDSADKNFFNNGKAKVKYFIFTDSKIIPKTEREYQIIKIDHRSFPYASMDRFKHFTNNSSALLEIDYLYYVDVDCTFVDSVDEEVLGNLVGVRHCGYFNGSGTFENNQKSALYVDPSKYTYYMAGGFNGGKSTNYLEMAKWCYDAIEKDLSNGIIPRFHDETALNRYFLDHVPDVILNPSYHYPQSDLGRYLKIWGGNKFKPRILLLDKNHTEVRK